MRKRDTELCREGERERERESTGMTVGLVLYGISKLYLIVQSLQSTAPH